MSKLTTSMAQRLSDTSTITAIAEDRIYDYDIRRAGSIAEVGVFDPYGYVKPMVMVDDFGETLGFVGNPLVTTSQIQVWLFVPRTPIGLGQLDLLRAETIKALSRWQDPVTGAILTYNGRIGEQLTDSPDDSYMDRLAFRSGTIVPGEW